MSTDLISKEQRALEEPISLALVKFFGSAEAISVRSASAPYSHFCWIVDQPGLSLFIKAAGGEGMIEEAVKVRAGEIGAQYSDEFAFHRLVAPLCLENLPKMMGSLSVGKGMRLLLLELIKGDLLLVSAHGGPRWQDCARVIASLNFALEGIAKFFPVRNSLPGAGGGAEQAYRRALGAAGKISSVLYELLADNERCILASIELVERSVTAAIHGELTPFNVFVEESTGRTVIVDWERFCRGPALFDLVTLLFAYPPNTEGLEEVELAYYEEYEKHQSGGREEFDRLLAATGIFHVLWLLLTIPEVYWHPNDEAKKTRRKPAIEAMERRLSASMQRARHGRTFR